MSDHNGSSVRVDGAPIIVCGEVRQLEGLLSGWCQFHTFENTKALKKLCRRSQPALFVAHVFDEKSEDLARNSAEYLRLGLALSDTRIIVFSDLHYVVNRSSWPKALDVTAFLDYEKSNILFNQDLLKGELDNYQRISEVNKKHRQEVALLMAITRFSDAGESFDAILSHFSKCLGDVCESCLSMQINVAKDEAVIENFSRDDILSESELRTAFSLPALTGGFAHAVQEKKPQVFLAVDEFDIGVVQKKLNVEIAGYLVFPILTYTKVVKILVYFVAEQDMGSISVSKVDLISRAFDQMRLLLERNAAESQLKKQYARLRRTLLELRLAKEEILQKEKMASVGKFAAGVAHEVNNPLAYVMSNMSSIDSYLESIFHLQSLHSEMLQAIDSGNSELSRVLKNNIDDYQEESDMSFVLSDIRSVVAESKDGLSRVKEIVKDLQTFHKHAIDANSGSNLEEVVDKSVKLFKYDLEGISIDVKVEASSSPLQNGAAVQQILEHFIKNAIYSLNTTEGEKKELKIVARTHDGAVEITVYDNGGGIEEALHKRVFEPFFTTKPPGDGPGLGLSLSYNLAANMGGKITLDSRSGEYAKFSLVLPEATDQKAI